MTQYLLSVWHAEDAEVYPDDETMQRAFTQVDAFNQELQASGSWLFAGGVSCASSYGPGLRQLHGTTWEGSLRSAG